MFGKKRKSAETCAEQDLATALVSVLNRTQAMIEFTPDGRILTANDNFLEAMGYSLAEIQGQHHSIFVESEFAESERYRAFWQSLAAGEFFTDQFARVAGDGSTVWINATYAPVFDADGKVLKVIKIATDITARRTGIEKIAQALHDLSEGNLALELAPCGVADVDKLNLAFNAAIVRFSDAINAAKEVAGAVERTASEVGESSADLSRRTENQAATLEETAAAIKDLAATADIAAEGAKDMERSAKTARATAENGGVVVSNAVKAMSNIEDSSNRISQIIGVIDDIAFQTNLLALNAGVEAARAGDAGRGFAVVASEIRLLAQRSAEAADEIKSLITDSSHHVSSGVDLVHQAGEELKKIVSGVADIYTHINKITDGASEQAVSLNEINSAVDQLDTVTQQNAAMVEESTAVGQTLATDARKLSLQMEMFRTARDGRPASPQLIEPQDQEQLEPGSILRAS